VLSHRDFPRRPFILIAKGMGLTYWRKARNNEQLKAMSKFIQTREDALLDIANFKKSEDDDAVRLNLLSDQTKKLLELHLNPPGGVPRDLIATAERAIT
jgi:hypothetical protein